MRFPQVFVEGATYSKITRIKKSLADEAEGRGARKSATRLRRFDVGVFHAEAPIGVDRTAKDDAPRAKRGFWPRIANKARSEILSGGDVDVVVAGAAVSLASGAGAYFALFRFAVKLCSSGPK